MRQQSCLCLVVSILLGWGAFISAQEPDQLREKARALKQEAAALAKQGRGDAAEQMERQSLQLLREADRIAAKRGGPEEARSAIEAEIREVKQHIQDLMAKEKALGESRAPEVDRAAVREQIAQAHARIAEFRHRLEGRSRPPEEMEHHARRIAEALEKLQHIRVAAEHLKAAGAHDLAMQLMEKAQAMEKEIAEAKRQVEGAAGHAADPRDLEMQELRRQNQRLRAELDELRRSREKP